MAKKEHRHFKEKKKEKIERQLSENKEDQQFKFELRREPSIEWLNIREKRVD